MKVHLSRRLSGLFLLLGGMVTAFSGYQVWQSWVLYESTVSAQHQVKIVHSVGQLITALQRVRLASVCYIEAVKPSDQEIYNTVLQQTSWQEPLRIATQLQTVLSVSTDLPINLQRFADALPEQLNEMNRMLAQIAQHKTTSRETIRHISATISFLMSGLFSITNSVDVNREVRGIYELERLQEAVGLLRMEGSLAFLSDRHDQHDHLLRALQRLSDAVTNVGYFDDSLRDLVKIQLVELAEWELMLLESEALLHDRTFASLTVGEWIDLMTGHVNRVAMLSNQRQAQLTLALNEQQTSAKMQFMLFASLWLLLTLALIWLYLIWVVRWFIGGFQSITVELERVQEQMKKDIFHPIVLSESVKSQEFISLIEITNSLLSHLTWQEDRHQSSQQKMHQDRLLTIGKMAASMAHEINNPITGIMVNLTYLSEVIAEAENKVVVDETLNEVKRVSKLIQSMLGFSRRSVTHYQDCQFDEVLSQVLAMTQGLLKQNHIFLITELEAVRGIRVLADSDSLKQILINLMNNAVQAMETATERRISLDARITSSTPPKLLIRIADTGSGVPDALRQKIFDPFFTTKPADKGTGLGLSICMKLAEDMGAILTLDDTYTQGARFLLYLPLSKAAIDISNRHALLSGASSV